MFKLKRAYGEPSHDDGARYLRGSRARGWAKGPVTLVYSAHDTEHTNAVALPEYLSKQVGRPGGRLRTRGSAPHASPK